MKLCLKSQAKQAGLRQVALTLVDRLPAQLQGPCALRCDLDVTQQGEYYLLRLALFGETTLTCQRCLNAFSHGINTQSELAVCRDDATADSMMARFDCLVSADDELDIIEIVTDEMHLFLPESHPEPSDCQEEIGRMIQYCLE